MPRAQTKEKRVEKADDDGQKDKGEEGGEDDEEKHRLKEELTNKIEEIKLIKLQHI